MSDQPAQTPPNAQASGTQAGGNSTNSTFTQEQVNAIVADRLTRDRAKFADYDELKKKAEAHDALQEAQKTELQKAQDALAKSEQEKQAALRLASERMAKAAFIEAASALGVKRPTDAYALALADGMTFAVDGDTITGVKEAVKLLVDDGRLPLTTRPAAPPLDGGAGSGDRSNVPTLTPEETAMAAKMGLTAEQYAKNKIKK